MSDFSPCPVALRTPVGDLVCAGRAFAELRKVHLEVIQPLRAAASSLPGTVACTWSMLDLHSVKTCAALLLDLMDGNARTSGAVRSTLMELPRSCCTAAWLERLPCLGFSNFEKGNNALIMLRCP